MIWLLACMSGEPTDTQDTSDSTTDTAGDTADTTDTGPDVHPDAPVITACDAPCSEHQTGDQTSVWVLECSGTDPQGLDNLWRGVFDASQGDTTRHTDVLACRDGTCTGSFTSTVSGLTCDQAASVVFTVQLEDHEGHLSAPVQVTGRQQ